MSGRRGFLALVGSAFVIGDVRVGQAARPTLLVPPGLIPATSADAGMPEPSSPTGFPLLGAVLSGGRSQMDAILDCKAGMPDELFYDWLEGGLRIVRGCRPGGQIYRAIQVDLANGIDPWGKA